MRGMFSSRAPIPARLATQLVLRRTAQKNLPLVSLPTQQCRRRYVKGPMRAPSVQRRKKKPQQSAHRLLFKLDDVPLLEFWQNSTSQNGFTDVSPENCLAAALQYASVASPDSGGWESSLLRDNNNIDLHTFYCTAVSLFSAPNQSQRFMGHHMLLTTSSLGHTPATLTLMRLLTMIDNDDTFRRRRADMAEVEARFKRLLQTDEDPDALTSQGLLLLREKGAGAETYALRYFDQAVKAARNIPSDADLQVTDQQGIPATRKPRWTFEGSCHLMRGHTLLRRGQTDGARASFRIAALELNLAEGYLQLANLLPQDAPEGKTCLLKAAQGGQFEASHKLAFGLADKAANPAFPWRDRLEAADMAYEWTQVEPELDVREAVQNLVAEKVKEVTEQRKGFLARFGLWR